MPKLRWRERELVRRFYGPSAVGALERRFLEAIERLASVDLPKRQGL